MTPRGSITAAPVGRTWRRHRAAASQTALIVALASGLPSGFGAVVERLTAEGMASCGSRATGSSDSLMVSEPGRIDDRFGARRSGTVRLFRHVVDRSYEEPAMAPTGACASSVRASR
jgi:hypothetical protein